VGRNGDADVVAVLAALHGGAAAVVDQGRHRLPVEAGAVERLGRAGREAQGTAAVRLRPGEVDRVVELPGGQVPDVGLGRRRAADAAQVLGIDVDGEVAAVPVDLRAGEVELGLLLLRTLGRVDGVERVAGGVADAGGGRGAEARVADVAAADQPRAGDLTGRLGEGQSGDERGGIGGQQVAVVGPGHLQRAVGADVAADEVGHVAVADVLDAAHRALQAHVVDVVRADA